MDVLEKERPKVIMIHFANQGKIIPLYAIRSVEKLDEVSFEGLTASKIILNRGVEKTTSGFGEMELCYGNDYNLREAQFDSILNMMIENDYKVTTL